MTKGNNLSDFTKLCTKCDKRKHVSKFKFRGKIYGECGDCKLEALTKKYISNFKKSETESERVNTD